MGVEMVDLAVRFHNCSFCDLVCACDESSLDSAWHSYPDAASCLARFLVQTTVSFTAIDRRMGDQRISGKYLACPLLNTESFEGIQTSTPFQRNR